MSETLSAVMTPRATTARVAALYVGAAMHDWLTAPARM